MVNIEIDTDSAPLQQHRQYHKKKQKRVGMIAGGGVLLVLLGIIFVARLGGGGDKTPKSDPNAAEQPKGGVAEPGKSRATGGGAGERKAAPANKPASRGPVLVEDDGRTMWVSPTAGEAIDLGYLPTGCQMFIALRPFDLLQAGEGEKIGVALGPLGEQGQQFVERSTGLRLADIDRLLIGIRPGKNFVVEYAMVVTPVAGIQPKPSQESYTPPEAGGQLVVASPALLTEIQTLQGEAPLLRREMQSLLATTDSERHVTVLVAPNFLFNEGRLLWSGSMAGLRDPLLAILPDSTRAAAFSLHWGDNFFAEVRLSSTIDHRPKDFAREFSEKVADWPASAEQAMLGLSATPYSRAVVARLPAMLRVLARYVRVGDDQKQALLRAYLPVAAGHNLLTAGELMLAEQFASPGGGSVAIGPLAIDPATKPLALEERLQKPTSLSFTRDTLEMAIRLLSDDIGVEIKILGGDLQLDGITKNQSFGMNENDRPAGEILVQILRLANPDKTATSPADPKQKLVYVFGTKPSTEEPMIYVTTRAQAKKRGDRLPAVFGE